MASDREVERDFAISPTSTHVVFKSDTRVDDVYELYSVPISGGTPTKLNPNIGGGKDVSSFVITPDGEFER
mgnify:CR=1 FL=1